MMCETNDSDIVHVVPHLRWGIIGTGGIAAQFAEDLRSQHGSAATAVLSRDKERARNFGARTGVVDQTLCTDDFAVFAAAVDVAYIATPHTDHVNDALRCLRVGLHVLVEKPLALTMDGAQAVFEEASARSLFAMEAMWTRFIPAFMAATAAAESGEIGRVTHIRIDHGFDGSAASSRLTDPALAGGAWYDLGSYAIACSYAMLGRPRGAVSASAAVTERHTTGVDATTEGHIILTGTGGTVSFRTSISDGAAKNTLAAIGDKGSIVIEAPFHHPTTFVVNGRREVFPLCGHGLWYQAVEVERCIARGELQSSLCTWDESKSWAAAIECVAAAAKIPKFFIRDSDAAIQSKDRSVLRVAVLGMGRIGSLHAATLKSLGVGTVLGVDAGDALPGAGTIDAAVVASWSSAHEEHVRHCAITLGVPVFCEKPLTDGWESSVALAKDLVKQGAASRVQLGFQRRFDPPLVACKAAASRESLGPVRTVRIDSRDPQPPPAEYMAQMGNTISRYSARCINASDVHLCSCNARHECALYAPCLVARRGHAMLLLLRLESNHDTRERALTKHSHKPTSAPTPAFTPTHTHTLGSHFYDMTIHDFDEARWLLGEEPVVVKASLTQDKMRAHVELGCASGAVATIVNDRCCALGYDQRAEIFCDKGRAASDSLPCDSRAFFLQRYADAYRASLDDFLTRVVEEGQVPLVGVRDGLAAALLAKCADEAAVSGRAVTVPPLPAEIQTDDCNN